MEQEPPPQSSSNGELPQEIATLLGKEKAHRITEEDAATRLIAVEWILRAFTHHGFSSSTAVLAVNFLDRCTQIVDFGKPWLARLAAVACLSIAAKIEEDRAPLLIDLQMDGPVFESKTVQKMEIVVLSTLDWRMRPVTALNFVHCFIARIKLNKLLSVELARRCDKVLLAILPDHRFTRFAPSVLAASAMCHVVKGRRPVSELEIQLLSTLNVQQKQHDECMMLIGEIFSCKRKLVSTEEPPLTPHAMVDMSFNGHDSDEFVDTSSPPSTWEVIRTDTNVGSI